LAASFVCGYTGAAFTKTKAVDDTAFVMGDVRIGAALESELQPVGSGGEPGTAGGNYSIAWTFTNLGSIPCSIRVIPEFYYTVGETETQRLPAESITGAEGEPLNIAGWTHEVEDVDDDGSDDIVFYYTGTLAPGGSATLTLPFGFESEPVSEAAHLAVAGSVQAIQEAHSGGANGWTWDTTQIENNIP
jgi:hypothetical protein